MRIPVAKIARSTAAALALAVGSMPAPAAFPERPITLVVPAAAGGQTDAIARIVAAHMAKTLGQPIVVENVAGGGGTIAAARVAHAAGDGYTIMMGHMGTHGAAPALHRDLIGSVVPERADRTPQALQMLVESEVVRWSSVLKSAGVAAN